MTHSSKRLLVSKKKRERTILSVAVTLFVGMGVIALGCASTKLASKGRAQLWQANCARCHALISPAIHSDAEWDVIVHHMRLTASLTTEEQEAIVEFLKAGN